MSSETNPLVADAVTVRLGGTPIVSNVTFTLESGDLALLSGLNGAGKSTLLRALVSLLPADGDIFINGFRPSAPEARHEFIYVPDEAALFEDLTLREHMRFTVMIYGQPEAEQRMESWLAAFRLESRLDEFPGTHSRGMRQKLALALALGVSTPLLVLDEPYNGLDADAQEILSAALQERCRAGGAVLLTGHQGELVTVLGARNLHLEDGQLQA
jgi:ABC-type multidrug transport system ATPase subunit